MSSDFQSTATLIASVVAAVASIIVMVMQCLKDWFSYKRSVYRERLEKMYIPFYKIYFSAQLFKNKLTDYDTDVTIGLMFLFNENIHYLDADSQSLCCDVYFYYAKLTSCKDILSNSEILQCEKNLNASFTELTRTVLAEYTWLLQKCRLPRPKSLEEASQSM